MEKTLPLPFDAEFVRWVKENEEARRLTTIPLIGAIVASALIAAAGRAESFKHGRELAAWSAFTLPSAILLLLFAHGMPAIQGRFDDGLLHGLKVVAVAVVAQAVWGMARSLCPDRERASIAGSSRGSSAAVVSSTTG